MRFFTGEKEILFDEFKLLAAEESKVLEGALDLEADFELDQVGRLALRSDFSSPVALYPAKELDYHRKFFFKNSVYAQPLGKALGIKKGKRRPKVLDASAGVLKDSCLILSFGCQVLACERHPVAQALILNALKTVKLEGFEFVPREAGELVATRDDYDVIYFDPMYEHGNPKAAPRKEMRIFREVVKADTDAKATARTLRRRTKRLVLKRSSKGAPLLDTPAMSYGKKSTVYDVYLA